MEINEKEYIEIKNILQKLLQSNLPPDQKKRVQRMKEILK